MIVALIILASVLSYSFIAGRAGGSYYKGAHERCGRRCYHDHEMSAVFVGLLFPVALPMMLGLYGPSAFGITTGNRLSRAEKRRAKELAEANHKKELARIDAQTTQELEKALR